MKSARRLLVDGYNIINAWPQLIELKEHLDHARDKLVDILAHYGAFKEYLIVLVFDAHLAAGNEARQYISKGVTVIYTDYGQTADSCIERLAYDLVRQGAEVYVATSDGVEQMQILGAGAYRVSARELLKDVQRVNKCIRDKFVESPHHCRRHEIENRINDDVARRLNELRYRL